MRDFDLVIIGSGFSGSLLAMVARRLGQSVLLVERGTHPRFAIGESTSPLTNLLLEEIAARYDLPRLAPLASYGAWQRTYPDIVCGLKRGFTYFHHTRSQAYRPDLDRGNQLVVAASPHDDLADTHWLRADVDHFLLDEAVALGTEYRDETRLDAAEPEADGGMTLRGERHGVPFAVCARFVVDASGPRGFLSRALGLSQSAFPGYPATQSLFSHFSHVRRCDEIEDFRTEGIPPYPLDDAALHHLFDGGWMWVLRFGNGVTSAGIAVTDALAEELDLAEGEPAWHRFLTMFPSIGKQFRNACPVEPFRHAPTLAYRSARVVGRGWAMMPSSAAFVDPLFSTGIPLTLLGIERLGHVLEQPPGACCETSLEDYERVTLEEADWVAHYIGTCYASLSRFDRFATLSQFYFAAASYAEMARRLDRRHLSPRFLAADDAQFRAGVDWCGRHFGDHSCSREAFGKAVSHAIESRNIAGLQDPTKQNWYGVDLEDVVRGAGKLGLTPEAVRAAIAVAPWAKPAPTA